jgi:choline kinase
MLSFGDRSLAERHLAIVSAIGASEVVIVTGFMADALEAHVRSLDPAIPVRFVHNARFREGSVVSCAAAGATLRSGATVLLMDGDVLYDERMHRRLLGGTSENVLLFDRNIEPGDEPVKICLAADGRITDFRKRPVHPHVEHGESVGFFRFSPGAAAELADRADAYAAGDGVAQEYEEAIRDMILAEPDRFGIVDISDLPWTEIDFPEDVVRARHEILPLLEA